MHSCTIDASISCICDPTYALLSPPASLLPIDSRRSYKRSATLFRLKTAYFLNMCWVKIARASAWLRKPASIQLFFALCLVHIRTKSSTSSLHSPKLPNASPRMRPNSASALLWLNHHHHQRLDYFLPPTWSSSTCAPLSPPSPPFSAPSTPPPSPHQLQSELQHSYVLVYDFEKFIRRVAFCCASSSSSSSARFLSLARFLA